eukprot:7376169-Prymnesium_polylepis.1
MAVGVAGAGTGCAAAHLSDLSKRVDGEDELEERVAKAVGEDALLLVNVGRALLHADDHDNLLGDRLLGDARDGLDQQLERLLVRRHHADVLHLLALVGRAHGPPVGRGRTKHPPRVAKAEEGRVGEVERHDELRGDARAVSSTWWQQAAVCSAEGASHVDDNRDAVRQRAGAVDRHERQPEWVPAEVLVGLGEGVRLLDVHAVVYRRAKLLDLPLAHVAALGDRKVARAAQLRPAGVARFGAALGSHGGIIARGGVLDRCDIAKLCRRLLHGAHVTEGERRRQRRQRIGRLVRQRLQALARCVAREAEHRRLLVVGRQARRESHACRVRRACWSAGMLGSSSGPALALRSSRLLRSLLPGSFGSCGSFPEKTFAN